MPRIKFCKIFLLTLVHLVTLVLATGPNWSKIKMTDIDFLETGSEIGDRTGFDITETDDSILAKGTINLTMNVDPKTTVLWKALYLNPDDNQYHVQAESKPTGLCDFMVFQSAVAQMFFKDSNMTVCPFQKGWYTFPNSGPIKEAFPQRIPEGRDNWKVEVLAKKMSGEVVAHFMIGAKLMR